MDNLHRHEEERFFGFLMAFCHRISAQQPRHYDAVRAIREQAEREYKAGILFSETKGENMWRKYLAPFKTIAKDLQIRVKGTPEERIKKQIETYRSMEQSRKRANVTILQK